MAQAVKRGYKFGVRWIADNDDPGSSDAQNVEAVKGYISVLLLADLFGKDALEVAEAVVKVRRQEVI